MLRQTSSADNRENAWAVTKPSAGSQREMAAARSCTLNGLLINLAHLLRLARIRFAAKTGLRCTAWLLCATTSWSASAMQGASASTGPAHAPARPRVRHRGAVHSENLVEAAKPATVVFENGQLKVAADNSDLSEILKLVATKTGMAIEGSISGARVFGVYGPYSPREVLTDLLTGSGYNFILTGNMADNTPKQLLLTPQTATLPTEASVSMAPGVSDLPANSRETAPVPQQPETLPPGEGPPAPTQDPQLRMQQRLERLEQMRHPVPPTGSPQ